MQARAPPRAQELAPTAGPQGMDLLGDCEFIAIFDADFKPEPDFLASGCLTTVASKRPAFIKAVG